MCTAPHSHHARAPVSFTRPKSATALFRLWSAIFFAIFLRLPPNKSPDFRLTFHQFRSGWLCYFCYYAHSRAPCDSESSMVSLDQMTKLRELLDQGWRTVPRTTTMVDMKLGGPTLQRKGDKYVMVYANGELVEPTPEEIAKW